VTGLLKRLSVILLLSGLCLAVNIKEHLVSVQHSTLQLSLPPTIQRIQGSGICINQSCSVVATAYHIQMCLGKSELGIDGVHTDKILSLANQRDTNKADVPVNVNGKMRHLSYNLEHDVSFVYTKKPVDHKSGVPYSYRSYVGQKVKVAGYYRNRFTTWDAHIIGVDVPLMWGQTSLNENLILDIPMESGSSGSAVLDENGNLLGMITLSGTMKSKSGDVTASVALPTKLIAEALRRLDPLLGFSVFNNLPEEQLTPTQTTPVRYELSDIPDDTSPVVSTLSATPTDVPDPVGKLHAQSEAASKLMVNFITRQCVVQQTQRPLCHELFVAAGRQMYRKIGRDGKLGKPTDSFPVQKYGVWTQSDWTDTLGEIADSPWVFQGSVGDHYLFTSKSTVVDGRCYYQEYSQGTSLFGRGHPGWEGSVACFEQVLTDKDFNVLSVFTEMHPAEGCLTQLVQTAIYYDWIKITEGEKPILLPIRERIAAKVRGQKTLSYTDVSWTDYREFGAEHKITF